MSSEHTETEQPDVPSVLFSFWGVVMFFVMLGLFIAGIKNHNTLFYVALAALLTVLSVLARKKLNFFMRSGLTVVICGLISAGAISCFANSDATEKRESEQNTQRAKMNKRRMFDDLRARQKQQTAALTTGMNYLYGKGFVIDYVDIGNHEMNFSLFNSGCTYSVPYVRLDEAFTFKWSDGLVYGPVEGQEVRDEATRVVVSGHAEAIPCPEHPLKTARKTLHH